ncbi:ankyrin repeat domain-containing protein [Thalassotalea sp. M1531]|uniref:Ankyrin repeat domain-containing protein n=1 Tax=Thalassotalea algicola TaxID=2716224 RepID=A0A7Y0LCJ5_9GAMM|nr:ankyrin repeat domain-containing protein [Thalassotalea algicola]NMP32085.1 ankyrin repeat domain-containing protein [Thalassotalea algicola]
MKYSVKDSFHKLKVTAFAATITLAASASFAHSYKDDGNDETARVIAKGKLAQIEQLIDDGLDINQNIGNDGTPLIIAVQSERNDIVKYLVERGADVNKASIQDGNPLINAALTNNVELLDYLHRHGAQLDIIVEHDETALISASRAGNFKAVKFLVEHGADVNLSVLVEKIRGDTELRSPLNGAKTKEIYRYLIANGAES